MVPLTRADTRSILGAIHDNKLSQIGQDLGKRAFKELMMLWFKKIDVESVLEEISLWCKYTGNARYDLETDGIFIAHGSRFATIGLGLLTIILASLALAFPAAAAPKCLFTCSKVIQAILKDASQKRSRTFDCEMIDSKKQRIINLK